MLADDVGDATAMNLGWRQLRRQVTLSPERTWQLRPVSRRRHSTLPKEESQMAISTVPSRF